MSLVILITVYCITLVTKVQRIWYWINQKSLICYCSLLSFACLLNIVLIFWGEILSWSLVGVEGLTQRLFFILWIEWFYPWSERVLVMPKKVKSSVTRFVRLPLAYRLQLSVFHVFRASVGRCEARARTMTQLRSSPPPPPPPFVHLVLAQFSSLEKQRVLMFSS